MTSLLILTEPNNRYPKHQPYILMKKLILPLVLLSGVAMGQTNLRPEIDKKAGAIEAKVIEWRRDIHKNPELGNNEIRTAKMVADHLRALGIEVQEGVAVTGVVFLFLSFLQENRTKSKSGKIFLMIIKSKIVTCVFTKARLNQLKWSNKFCCKLSFEKSSGE